MGEWDIEKIRDLSGEGHIAAIYKYLLPMHGGNDRLIWSDTCDGKFDGSVCLHSSLTIA